MIGECRNKPKGPTPLAKAERDLRNKQSHMCHRFGTTTPINRSQIWPTGRDLGGGTSTPKQLVGTKLCILLLAGLTCTRPPVYTHPSSTSFPQLLGQHILLTGEGAAQADIKKSSPLFPQTQISTHNFQLQI